MKIAVDIRALMDGRHSGVEEYVLQLLRAMASVGEEHEFHAFCNAGGGVRLPRMPEGVYVHVFRLPNKVLNGVQLASGQPKWNRLVKADVFFAPGLRLLPLDARVPLVATAHDLSFVRFPEFYTVRQRWWHWYVQPKRLLRRARKVIAVSESTARDLRELYGIAREKVKVIHSGFKTKSVSEEEIDKVRRKLSLSKRYVLFLGASEPRKNVAGLIRAFDRIADSIEHDLVLAGCSGWLPGEMQKALNECAAASRIRVIGFVSQKDKDALYAGADLFVYPSFYEGFGFPPLEALASGTPVITSFNSSLPEVVGRWATMIDPYRMEELALVMKEMLAKPGRISEVTREEIRQKYSWERAGRETLEVIQSVIND